MSRCDLLPGAVGVPDHEAGRHQRAHAVVEGVPVHAPTPAGSRCGAPRPPPSSVRSSTVHSEVLLMVAMSRPTSAQWPREDLELARELIER